MGKIGVCKICGLKKELSKEHIPPQSAYNDFYGKEFKGEEVLSQLSSTRLPWELNGLKYKYFQSGYKTTTICEECNKFTGSKYGRDYVKFIHDVGDLLQENKIISNTEYIMKIENCYPLRIFKQMISQFCSITSIAKSGVKEFILNAESKKFPNDKYRLLINLFEEGSQIISGPMVMNVSGTSIAISEIRYFPISMILIMNYDYIQNIDLKTLGTDITYFSQFDYNLKMDLELIVRSRPQHTVIPFDYRSKQNIEKDWNKKKK